MSGTGAGGGAHKPQSNVMGIGVGTRSARAGLFDTDGDLVAAGRHDIAVLRYGADYHEHSSEGICQAVHECIRSMPAPSGIAPASVAGIVVDQNHKNTNETVGNAQSAIDF
jgi:D-ribulokinase